MKKLLLYLLLVSYAIVTFKPVLPYVSDFVAHNFYYAHHMATVHFENGKHHVHYQLVNDVKNESSGKSPSSSSQKDNAASEHFATEFRQTCFVIAANEVEYKTTTAPAIENCNAAKDYPPPRV